MRVRYIPAAITLIAGTITSIISIIYQYSVIESLILLLFALIAFYIIGCVARNLIVYAVTITNSEESDSSEEELLEDSTQNQSNGEQSENIQEQ